MVKKNVNQKFALPIDFGLNFRPCMDFLLLVCGVDIGDGSDFWLATSEPVPPPSDSCSNDSDTDTDLKLDRKVLLF